MKANALPCILFLLFLGLWNPSQAQIPLGVSYQGVARVNGNLLTNNSLQVRFTVREGSASGPSVYQEEHLANTNAYGLFSLTIGEGLPVFGQWDEIDWAKDIYFLRVELDLGSGFFNLGTNRFEAVPYSYLAGQALMQVNDLLDASVVEPDSGNVLKWNGFQWVDLPDQNTIYSAGAGISLSQDTIHNTGDLDPNDDITQTTLAGGDLTGLYPAPIVQGIRGFQVSPQIPLPGQVLKWNGSSWQPLPDDRGPWVENGTTIFYTAGNVGILENAPTTPLHVGDNQRVLFGQDLIGSGSKCYWLPDKGAFRAGTVTSGIYAAYWDADTDSVGLHSAAFGRRTKAKGSGAFAAGNNSYASGSYSFAVGADTRANGNYSLAANRNNRAVGISSNAFGYLNDANGDYSATFGLNLNADAYASFVVGRYNLGGGSPNQWIVANTEPVFEVGIGTSTFNKANGLTVFKDGLVQIPGRLRIGSGEELSDGGSLTIAVNSHIAPQIDATRSLGRSDLRWNTIYALNGTINTSDLREKTEIEDLKYGLDEILQLRPVSYTWIHHPEQGTRLGLIAQEVAEIIPETVHDTDWTVNERTGEAESQASDMLGLYYSDMVPVLIKAVKEQQQLIVSQGQQLQQMQIQLQQQTRMIEALQKRVDQLSSN